MKVNCDYCGSFIESTDEMCPNCGAVNTHFVRTAVDTPTTIEELKAFCAEKKLPLDKMHIHIGEDFKAPKAFGIYFDDKTQHYVVYKNKGDGSRAIRYEGTDEKYAVNELYLKIKDIILDKRELDVKLKNQALDSGRRPVAKSKSKKSFWTKGKITLLVFIILIIFALIDNAINPNQNGYYKYKGNNYYHHGDYWYMYDDDEDDWSAVSNPGIDSDNYEKYYYGSSYDSDYKFDAFPTAEYSSDWGSDWDSDDDWSSSSDDDWDWGSDDSWDSWDSGSDWDSDW